MQTPERPLAGRVALVVGVANDRSIAYGCARALRAQGAEIALTYQTEKARPHVEPLARELAATLSLPLDVRDEGQMDAVFEAVRARWGRLDVLVHSIAFAPREDLHGPLVDCSAEGFALAMDVSCHSLMRLARRAVPLMADGGTILTMTFFGSTRVVPEYNLMGPVKAALEASVRQMAVELGPRGVRVHALSPGPIATRAGSGLKDFDRAIAWGRDESALGVNVGIDDVGAAAAFLAGPGAKHLTGLVLPIDAGLTIRA
jgi:enoyl-[acyl-carrier protein] reductase I